MRAAWTAQMPLGMLQRNRGAPSRGPPETAGGFRPFPFVGACRKGGEAQVLEAAAGLRLRRGTTHAYHDVPDDGAFTSAYLARFQAGLKAA